MTYDEILQKLGAGVETEEQKRRREKRERAQRIINGVTQGLLAGVNLAGTMAGGNHMQIPENTVRKEQEARRIAREKKENEYYDAAIRMRQAKLREREAEDARKQKENYNNYLLQLKKDEYDRDAARKDAAQKWQQNKWEQEQKQKEKAFEETQRVNNARIGAYNRSGRGHSGGGSNRYYGTYNGKAYATQADYEAAIDRDAQSLGVPTTKKERGVTKRRDTREIRRDVESKRSAKSPAGNKKPAGNNGGGKKKLPGW